VFEHRRARLLPRPLFLRRVARYAAISAGIVVASLALGAGGYHWIAGLDWVDALLNASMILSGMGPVSPLTTDAGKLFATAYALYSGLAFVTTIAVLAAPIAHRFFHVLHLEIDEADDETPRRAK
jgi:hypothetical protein